MKKIIFLLSIIVLTAGAVTAEDLYSSVAVISDYSGTVKLLKHGAVQEQNAEFGIPIHEGDLVMTGSFSHAEITFDNATMIKISSSSSLKIDAVSKQNKTFKAAFNLVTGKLHALFRKLNDDDSGTFEIRTKMALAAVKGTDVVVETSEDDTGLGVFEGEVEFFSINDDGTKGDKQEVTGGNESSVKKGDKKPSQTESLRRFLDDKQEIEKMRERYMKRKETVASGIYDEMKNRSDREDRLRRLKSKARKEIKNSAKKISDSSAYVRKEQKNDSGAGKYMTDAFGKRVRVEEFVVKPVNSAPLQAVYQDDEIYENNRIDFINITKRDSSTNVMINRYGFNYSFDYKPADWRRIWHNYDWNSYYNNGDSPNYVCYNHRTYKNLNSGNEIRYEFDYAAEPFSDYTQMRVDFVLFPQNEIVYVNGAILEYRYLSSYGTAGENPLTNLREYYYEMVKAYDTDKTYISGVDFPYEIITQFVGTQQKLPLSAKHNYNNEEWLEFKYYYIDEYGGDVSLDIEKAPFAQLSDYYLQLRIDSSLFSGEGVDLVSSGLLKEMMMPVTFYDSHVTRSVSEQIP